MPAKLVLSLDGQVIREFSLSKERITIGRKPHNDIQVDNLAVSGEHAAVITILNDSFMEDLGSTNGTLVNGQLVKKHFLQSGDVVELGKHKLRYVNDTPSSTSAEDFEKTMVLRRPVAVSPVASKEKSFGDTVVGAKSFSGTATKLPGEPAPAAVASPPPAPAIAAANAAIQVLNGASAGKVMELTKTLTTLGKTGVQVAVITKRPTGYFITHVEGANFPVVNGATLGSQAHQLNDHDIIELAGVKMEFFFRA